MLGKIGSSVSRVNHGTVSALAVQNRSFYSWNRPVYRSMKNPGGSYFRWFPTKKYVRHSESKYHYPEVSAVTGEKVDWLYGTPKSGYEAVDVWGANTIELKGMPMGRTPEYMQERLRRFFSKFGHVAACHAVPHPLDPYQCQGTAYISFKARQSVHQAIKAPLVFPLSLHSKVVSMKDLDTDKTNDPLWVHKQRHYNGQCIDVAKQLHAALLREGPRSLQNVWKGIMERDFVQGKGRQGKRGVADRCVYERFGGWEQFLLAAPFDELFHVSGSASDAAGKRSVTARVVGSQLVARTFVRAEAKLERSLHEACSVPWRQGKMALPEWTQQRVDAWQHKPALPVELQFASRVRDLYKVYDERLVEKLRRRQVFRARRNFLRKLTLEQEKSLKEEKKAQLAAGESKPTISQVLGGVKNKNALRVKA